MALGLIASAVTVLVKGTSTAPPKEVSSSELMKELAEGKIANVVFEGSQVAAKLKDGTELKATLVENTNMAQTIIDSGVGINSIPVLMEAASSMSPLHLWGPSILVLAVLFFIFKAQSRASGSGGPAGMSSFIASRTKRVTPSTQSVRFADVAGCDEAKAELEEIVEFLRDGEKFKKLGGRIPRGVMLSGPPGTGKTLLARAIAGEAKVPFFTISGSDFVEMFVGVGAARVRELFGQAKKCGTAIIFIDEIDAIGRSRSSGGTSGGNDEREQALNQMLVEMDGFDAQSNVIVVAATNRPDILDSALMRPGRFDRSVYVDLPDVKGREAILNVHLARIPLSADFDPAVVAKSTPGFSGAELQNLVNEAALMAARANSVRVEPEHFEKAMDKVTMGLERKTTRMDKEELLSTAYHEAGHAVLAKLLPGCDPVHKVSIVPRGRALGVTIQLPEKDRYSLSKKRILSDLQVLYGGRIAEDLFTSDITTGASNDYERATALARDYVSRWGMSDLGPIVVAESAGSPFGIARSGRGASSAASEQLLEAIDSEVSRLLKDQYQKAESLLKANSDIMHSMAHALMIHETIDAEQVQRLVSREWTLEEYVLGVHDKTGKTTDLPSPSAPDKATQVVAP